ncbi:MAG: hypothetical protein AAGF47_12530, partial [Planctomycetota bacterium]
VDWGGKQPDARANGPRPGTATGASGASSSQPSARANPGAPAGRTAVRPGTAPPSPGSPVKIDLVTDGQTPKAPGPKPVASSEPKPEPKPEPAPKPELVKAEEVRDSLRNELRDSYERAISLAEKVDQHLDTQEERSRRLLEIAENLPAALENIGAIGEGQDQLRSAVKDLSSTFREGQASTQKGLARQLESLGRVEGLIKESTDSQKEIRSSIENLAGAFDEISASNKRLGDTLTDMKQRDIEREERLQEANTKTHTLLKGLMIGGGVLGVLAVLALVAQVVVPLLAG